MQIRSLGIRTDLIFAHFSGEVIDRGDHIVVRTPSNPSFWWGNFLLFDRAPTLADTEPWLKRFAQELPESNHVAITWDTQEPGDTAGFEALGLKLEKSVVLTTHAVHPPPKVNHLSTCRPLESARDWQQWLALRMACNDRHEPGGYRLYLERKLLEYQRLEAAGRGRWFGAFLDDKLVCGMGLYHDDAPDRLARFQSVETHPDFRRRGLCGSLVYFAARWGLEQLQAKTLVMLADPDDHAAMIYQSVGFEPHELGFALERSADLPPLVR